MPKGKYKRTSFKNRFFRFVNKNGPIIQYVKGRCWVWTGALDKDGYGRIRPGNERINIRSNRASWIIHFGEIQKNMIICHHCDNTSCVNPNHLFIGTHQTNAEDRVKKGRYNIHYGEKCYASKLTNDQANEVREMYKSGLYYQKDLAKIFGITQSNISVILRNKSYHS